MTSYILLGILVQAFIFTIMLTVGLQVSLAEIKKVFRKRGVIWKTLILNLILAPLVAFIFLEAFEIDGPVATAILLLAVAPGAPFAPRIIEIGKGDLAFASGAVLLLSAIAVISGPISAQLLTGQQAIGFSLPWRLILVLIFFQLFPLLLGLWLHEKKPNRAANLIRPFHLLSNLLIASLAVVATFAFGDQFWQLTPKDWGIMLAVTFLWMISGALHRGDGALIRHTESLLMPARNIGLALFLALQGFGDATVIIPLLAQGAISLFVVSGIGWALGKQLEHPPSHLP